MAREWTPAQRSAIDTRDKTLLVSAAAGSGKTATLTERIISSLTDTSKPADISRMLIVTFTSAAAGELRSRISARISAAIAERGRNASLSRQLLLLPSAKICTIDSFCLDVLRKNAGLVGLSPSFRVMDDGESRLLSDSVMEQFIEELYLGEVAAVTRDELFLIVESLSDPRHPEGLGESLLSLYYKVRSLKDSSRTVTYLAEARLSELDLPVLKSTVGRVFYENSCELCDHYLSVYDRLLPLVLGDDITGAKYGDMLTGDVAMLRALKHALLKYDYDAVRRELFTYAPQNLGKITGGKPPIAEKAKDIRDKFKSDLKKLKGIFIYPTENDFRARCERAAKVQLALGQLLVAFEERLLEEKRRRALVSFDDIEAYAYALLVGEDGAPTPIALDLREAFDYIYIDEYQDVNPIQHGIFEAIAKPDNRFMVGDIKQSIYGFRHAEPEIFARMKKSLPELSEGETQAQINMSKNFRSARPVIDFVNSVFDKLFGITGESIGYVEDDRLVTGSSALVPVQPVVAVFDDDPENLESDDEGEYLSEYDFVAHEIDRLVRFERRADGQRFTYSDIAILVRKNASAKAVACVLEFSGVPTQISDGGEFFSSPEVLLALSYLGAIDNPSRDVDLAATMMSPLYSFDADAMIAVRACAAREDEPLIASLRTYAARTEDFRATHLLSDLVKYRRASSASSVDKLIWRIYNEKGMLALDDGSARRRLLVLYDYARRFESTSFKGLYNFVSYVREIIEAGKSLPTPGGNERDAVNVITCHHSKGLEYPVCFIVNADKDLFAKQSGNVKIVFDGEIGSAMELATRGGAAIENDPIFDAVNLNTHRRELLEELRVLYVALTRPRERLYITMSAAWNSSAERLVESRRSKGLFLDEYAVMTMKSFGEMVLACADEGLYTLLVNPKIYDETWSDEDDITDAPKEESEEGLDTRILDERFVWKYAHSYLKGLPSKLSVSRLSPTVLDESERDVTTLDATDGCEKETLAPKFITSERASGAERGTATHNFLQFCNFEGLSVYGAEAELERMITEGFLPATARELVNLYEIGRFVHSDMLREMLSADTMYRELRFNIMLPASKFTESEELAVSLDGEPLLVQGVMDCVLIKNGEVTLIDYKTDRLTREEIDDPALAREKLTSRYREQLSYYTEACRRMFGVSTVRVLIYSLPAACAFDVDVREI